MEPRYKLAVYKNDQPPKFWVSFETDAPVMGISLDQWISPVGWPGAEAGQMCKVVNVVHTFSQEGESLYQNTDVYVAVYDHTATNETGLNVASFYKRGDY